MQRLDYSTFPGPVVQSTNCIMEPRASYKDRLYTTNATGWPGVKHIVGRDFKDVIAQAQVMGGFKETKPSKVHLTGFGHEAVLGAAPVLLDAIKRGDLKRLVLIGGCDGSEGEVRACP